MYKNSIINMTKMFTPWFAAADGLVPPVFPPAFAVIRGFIVLTGVTVASAVVIVGDIVVVPDSGGSGGSGF